MHFNKHDFETRLREFFERHDPPKADLAHVLASRFHQHQDEVFEHLTKHYDPHRNDVEPSTFKEKLLAILVA
jgi:hypothetical protein